MTITYNWTINPLECYPTSSAHTDVVFVAHWQFHASEVVDGKTYSSTVIGTQSLPSPTGSAFTPFEELTLEQVRGWVEGAMGEERVEAMKASTAQQIANQINPPVVVLSSPWATLPMPVPPVPPTGSVEQA